MANGGAGIPHRRRRVRFSEGTTTPCQPRCVATAGVPVSVPFRKGDVEVPLPWLLALPIFRRPSRLRLIGTTDGIKWRHIWNTSRSCLLSVWEKCAIFLWRQQPSSRQHRRRQRECVRVFPKPSSSLIEQLRLKLRGGSWTTKKAMVELNHTEEEALSDETARRLRKVMEHLNETLSAELGGYWAYEVPTDGGHPI